MGLLAEILRLSKLPSLAPNLEITKDQKKDLIAGKRIIVKDPKYNADWIVFVPYEKIGLLKRL